jgi:hypothetical protein
VRVPQLVRLPQLLRLSQLVRLPQLVKLPHLVRRPQLARLPHLVRMLQQLMTHPYLGWQPPPTSIPHLGTQPRFILASFHSAFFTWVPHSWLNGSAGVPAVPATISMSDV